MNAVVEAAPAAIEEFQADYDAAMNAFTTITDSISSLSAKITTLNQKATLTDREIANVAKYTADLQKANIQVFAAGDKLNGIGSALTTA
jgi:peptidoglycan hydrolase CwlO-like protein